MAAKSIFEAEARYKKAQALLRAIDRGVGTVIAHAAVEEFLRAASDEWWIRLAKAAGVRAPSGITKDVVILEWSARAEESATDEAEADLGELNQW